MSMLFIIPALLIVAGLAFYAGRLLFLLRQQSLQQQARRQDRISNIVESIQTIAKAMEQQQCSISEGSIRLCILLESLPMDPHPDFVGRYPALHDLYSKIKHMPTHEARKHQARRDRQKMDGIREELEAQFASAIQREVTELHYFTV